MFLVLWRYYLDDIYRELAKFYDRIYYWKDYKNESHKIHNLIKKYKRSQGNEMLDVACGTGNHMLYLKKYCKITGIDLNREMLAFARKKLPKTKFIRGDMRKFHAHKKFDVIVYLFSAIAHMLTISDLQKAIKNFYAYLKTSGIVIIEPFISPDKYRKNYLHTIFVNEPDLKMTRMSISKKRGNLFIFDFHFLIMTNKGVKYMNEIDSVKMFKAKEYLSSMRIAGLKSEFLKDGLMRDRGIYIGIKK